MLAFLLALLSQTAEPPRVLVVATPADTDARQASLFAAHLTAEVRKIEGVRVVDATPAAREATSACGESSSCLAKLIETVGADLVVMARTSRLGDTSVVALKRLQLATGEIQRSSTRSYPYVGGHELLQAIGPGVEELFPDQPLRAGVSRGVPEALIARWDPAPLPPAVFYGGVAGTAAAVAVSVVLSLSAQSAEEDYRDYARSGSTIQGSRIVQLQDTADRAARNANIAWAGTGVLALATTLVGVVFTDWHAERDVALNQH